MGTVSPTVKLKNIFLRQIISKMALVAQLKDIAISAMADLFPETELTPGMFTINQTKPEFNGDYTIVLFPFVKLLRQKPDELGKKLGEYLLQHAFISSYEIVSGFLNLSFSDKLWTEFLHTELSNADFGCKPSTGRKIMVEYSSPNTNKPLHFGHLRNIFLGYAMSEILKANGEDVVKANLINDRGIHICKSMIAWQRYANGATPETANVKGDHLVGDYYVKFNDAYKGEVAQLVSEGMEQIRA